VKNVTGVSGTATGVVAVPEKKPPAAADSLKGKLRQDTTTQRRPSQKPPLQKPPPQKPTK
jgi:hypothetical protein